MSWKPCDKIANNQGFECFGEPGYPIAYKQSFELRKTEKKKKPELKEIIKKLTHGS